MESRSLITTLPRSSFPCPLDHTTLLITCARTYVYYHPNAILCFVELPVDLGRRTNRVVRPLLSNLGVCSEVRQHDLASSLSSPSQIRLFEPSSGSANTCVDHTRWCLSRCMIPSSVHEREGGSKCRFHSLSGSEPGLMKTMGARLRLVLGLGYSGGRNASATFIKV